MATRQSLEAAVQKQIGRARKRLEKVGDPGIGLMKQIGALIAKECRKSFHAQKLGDIEWQPRYPGMADPFINIAGALEDWNAGRAKPQPNRFQDRPALVGPGGGHLGRSITHKVGMVDAGKTAEIAIGTSTQYARIHQQGGPTEIPISDVAKVAIAEWLYKIPEKGTLIPSKKKTGHHGRSGKGKLEKTENFAYAKHVKPLLDKSVWRQNVIPRPFIGVTPQAEEEVVLAIRDYFKGVAE